MLSSAMLGLTSTVLKVYFQPVCVRTYAKGSWWIESLMPQWAVVKHTSASALSPSMVCSLPPWLGPPLPQWRCICTAVKSHGNPDRPIQSGSSITADGNRNKTSKPPKCRRGFRAALPGDEWGWSSINRPAATLLGYLPESSRLPIFTCVSIIAECERLVSMLVVAQWGQRGQAGVKSSKRGRHIDGGLRRATAGGEVLRPLGLTHQAFHRRKDRSDDVAWSHSPLTLSHSVKRRIDLPDYTTQLLLFPASPHRGNTFDQNVHLVWNTLKKKYEKA